MEIDTRQIIKIAKLSKFNITQDEAALYQKQIAAVFDWVRQLQDIDTSAITEEALTPAPLRGDQAVNFSGAGQITAAFSDSQDNFLRVKKVL